MLTRNLRKNPIKIKRTEREIDEDKEASINPATDLPFEWVWAMSIPGEECGNPQVSKCPSRKFKTRTPCCLSKLNGRVFHFPRCLAYASMTQEELMKKTIKRKAGKRVAKVREYSID